MRKEKVLVTDTIAEKYAKGMKYRFFLEEWTVINITKSHWPGCSYIHIKI